MARFHALLRLESRRNPSDALPGGGLAPKILVNSVAPGTIQFPGEAPDEDYIKRTPVHRTGTGEDIADAVAYFVKSNFVTGQILAVDGGRMLA